MLRAHGDSSTAMAKLLNNRAEALKILVRFDEARSAIAASLKIIEKVFGQGLEYTNCLVIFADILYREGKYEMALKHVEEARSLMKSNLAPHLLGRLLNLHAILLTEMKQYQKAVLVHEEDLAVTLHLLGPNHRDFATSLLGASLLYFKLKQIDRAVDLATKALEIRTKTLGPSHALTQEAVNLLASYQRALIDPEAKKKLASESHRMCNIDGCHTVKEKMNRCLKCLSHYLCKEHEGLIHEHVVVCPKFPDVLPDEEKLKKIVKCRRCRKETKLMKCAICESVWYCGATCQKEDWKRHKLFCGKK